MGIARYLFNDWFTAQELDVVDVKFATQERQRRRDRRQTEARIRQLELNLARVALLARALAETCVEEGRIPLEALKAKIAACDLFDGVEDGGLDPAVALPGEVAMEEVDPHADDDRAEPGSKAGGVKLPRKAFVAPGRPFKAEPAPGVEVEWSPLSGPTLQGGFQAPPAERDANPPDSPSTGLQK